MKNGMSRRDALQRLALFAGTLGALQGEARAAEMPHLRTDDPTAQALSYTDDAKKVDPKQFPSYMPGQMCANCLQLQGEPGQMWRPCNLFPGQLVNANGWCRVWVAK